MNPEQLDSVDMNKENSTITLIASDGTKCAISKNAAMISPVLKAIIQGPFQEKDEIDLPNIDPEVLYKVIEYLELKFKHLDESNGQEDYDITNFEFDVPPEISLELLLAADYLNI